MTKLRYFLIAILEPIERNTPKLIDWLAVKPSVAEQSNSALDAVSGTAATWPDTRN